MTKNYLSTVATCVFVLMGYLLFSQEGETKKQASDNNRFFLDFSVGPSIWMYSWDDHNIDYGTTTYDAKQLIIMLHVKAGNNFYFMHKNKWSGGLQVNWAKISVSLPPNLNHIAPLHVGMSNLFKLSDKLGLEFNATGGFVTEFEIGSTNHVDVRYGFGGSSELKLRFKKMTVGLEYGYYRILWEESNFKNDYQRLHMPGVVVGLVF